MNEAVLYTDVVLPVPLQQCFTYNVPDKFTSSVKVGCRVIVQFGNRKFYTAIIKKVHTQQPEYETKPIELVLDDSPIISENMFPFWEWISNYYLCTVGEVMKAALPSGLKLESQTSVVLNEEWVEKERLTPTEESVYQFIYSQKKASIQQINSLTKRSNAYPVLKTLLDKGAVIIEEELKENYRPKTIAHVSVSSSLVNEKEMEAAFESLKNAKKQLELFMFLLNELHFYAPQSIKSIAKKELLKKSASSESTLKGLSNRGLVEIFDFEVERLADTLEYKKAYQLNQYQEKAINEIYDQFRSKEVVLLHGVTSSGKTEVYIKMIEAQLKAGKQVLYLLPEIALTSQIIERLTAVFGNKAGIYHSKFNDSERVEIWNKVLEFNTGETTKYQLILGARSALFLPFKKLGLIIIDEEHETSFKQFDPAPRYNARDSAVMLAYLHKAKVLMGTATPSFETYFNAKTEKYGLVNLNQRHNDVSLPEIVVADLADAYKRKLMKSHFTPQLFSEIENALSNNEQIILFQNRRGFSSFIQCKLCGWIPNCKHCDVSLTYHKYFNNLQCHYCGYAINLPSKCEACGSTDVHTKGFGTEKIEDELKIFFPDIKIGRLDVDSTRAKRGYEKVIQNFASGKTKILVGTQMITKGLDFDNVSVVGILNADNLLNFPDFRSYERAYQLMAQVSGRAGRKKKQGKVIIQTYQAKHQVISMVINNDYDNFFKLYIHERKIFKYPPWYRLINITVKHKNSERAQTASKQLAAELRKVFGVRVFGPEFHLISRIQQYYQLIIRLKLEKNTSQAEAKKHLNEAIDKTKYIENNRSVIFNIDVDPY